MERSRVYAKLPDTCVVRRVARKKKTEKRLMRDSTGSETPQKKRLCVLGENTTDDDDSDA